MKRINLMPDHLKQAEARRRLRAVIGAAVACALIVAAAWLAAAMTQLHAIDRDIAAVERELAPLRTQHADVQKLRREKTDLAERLATVHNLREPVAPATLLALLSQLAPREAVLRELVIELPPVPRRDDNADGGGRASSRADGRPPPVRLQLEGMARDDVTVARLVRVLSEGRVFRNIRLTDSREIVFRDQPGHRFQIVMEVPLARHATTAHASGGTGR